MIVIDTSIAIGWFVDTQRSDVGERALDLAADAGWIVPFHFGLEFASSLRGLERRNKIAAAKTDAALLSISKMSPVVDLTTQHEPQTKLLPIARRFDITLYDAAYLELALRTKLPLATRDKELAKAAVKAGVALFK